MTYEQFWKGDPYLAQDYREAYKMRQDAENTSMWLQGMYFYDAVTVALGNAFASKRSQKQKYPEKPYQIREKTEKEKQSEAEEARKKAKEDFKRFGGFLNSKFGDKHG